MLKQIRPVLVLLVALTALTGLVYPLALTGVAQVAFPSAANGSLVAKDGKVIGSALIGQLFTAPGYFHGRLSATLGPDPADPSKSIATPYNAANSMGSNLGPTSQKLIDRIVFLDGFPNMQVLDPLHIGQTVKEVLDCDLAAEISARTLYEEAATHCHAVRDYVTRDLFESLMKDEEHHIDFLETQLDLIGRIGLELYTQKHVGGLESGD